MSKQTCIRHILRILLILGISGCTVLSAAPPPSAASGAWSPGITLAEAYLLDAPAVGVTDDGWITVWADGPALLTRRIASGGTASPTHALNLGTRAPWHPVLLPAPDDGWHLLWQDLDAFNDVRLYSARLDSEGMLLRGPITVTPEGISSAAAAPGDGYAAVVIWANTEPRPTLYGQRIDAQGRPGGGAPTVIARNAEAPAVARMADGRWVLAWLAWPDFHYAVRTGRVVTVRITDSPLPWEGAAEPVGLQVIADPPMTTYIETVTLGLDRHFGYVFISQRDAAAGEPHTDLVSFPLDLEPSQAALTPLTLPTVTDSEPSILTGFNTGMALAIPENESASAQSTAVSWPTPLWGQFDTLPAAFNVQGNIVIGYFQDGHLIGYQFPAPQAQMLGAPGLWVDRERYLSLAWARWPDREGGPARLTLSTTHPAMQPAENR